MALRFIYCVPLMEDRALSGSLDLSIVCPQWKIGVALRFIYCVPLMEDRSGS